MRKTKERKEKKKETENARALDIDITNGETVFLLDVHLPTADWRV